MNLDNNKHKKIDGIFKKVHIAQIANMPIEIPKINFAPKIARLSGAFVLALLVLIGLSRVGGTVSYFSDMEESIGNYFKADPLDFDVEVASSTEATVDLTFGGQVLLPIMSPKPDSSEIQYYVKSDYVSGDLGLCEAVKVFGTFPFPYDDKLLLLKTATTTATGAWSLEISIPDPSIFLNTSCVTDLVYVGWNNGLPEGTGFSHTEKIRLTINIGEIPSITTFSSARFVESNVVSDEDLASTTEEATTTDPTDESVSDDKPTPPKEEVVEPVTEDQNDENENVNESQSENAGEQIETEETENQNTDNPPQTEEVVSTPDESQ